jgi:Kelch motif/Galactose oxidase, central domain
MLDAYAVRIAAQVDFAIVRLTPEETLTQTFGVPSLKRASGVFYHENDTSTFTRLVAVLFSLRWADAWRCPCFSYVRRCWCNRVPLFPFNKKYTGSLNTRHAGHTATLLPDGSVLVAGGADGGAPSAELYHPATGTWTYAGSLNSARWGHTATLLSDGKVLVARGVMMYSTELSSAELYDPGTGTWTYTGSLNAGRYSHTATLLPNGKVLVAGGNDSGWQNLASAELYDPGVAVTTVDGRGTFDNQGNEVMFRFGADQADDGSKLGHFEFCDSAAGVCITKGTIRSLSHPEQHGQLQRLGSLGGRDQSQLRRECD